MVKGTPKGELFPTIGWKFHSYKPIEEFAPLASDLAPEYDLEILCICPLLGGKKNKKKYEVVSPEFTIINMCLLSYIFIL